MDVQTVLAILVSVALACFSLVMVGYSFFRNRAPQHEPATVTSGQEDDGVGLDSLFDSLETLELEFQLGNIPEQEYAQQLFSHRQQIAALVKEQLERGDAAPELLLEQEILRVRAGGVAVWRSCPQCDAPLPAPSADGTGAATCPHCNAALSPAALSKEPFCATPVTPVRQTEQ